MNIRILTYYCFYLMYKSCSLNSFCTNTVMLYSEPSATII